MITRVKGTQDFLDLSLTNFIIDQAREHLTTYHFTHIATPIIEPLALFTHSLGEHTDVVNKEMFVINPRTAGDDLLCLRPEVTAATVRAFAENKIQLSPWKVFSHGPMFRYERPQKGRYRQFHQINIEALNSHSVSNDVQTIVMLDRLFSEKIGINNYAITVNFLGCADDRTAYRAKLQNFLASQDASAICKTCTVRKDTNIMRIFDCKNPDCQALYQNAPFIADHLCTTCETEWQQVQKQLQLLSVSHAYQPTLVRGLDYYEKTVFEFSSDNLGAQNAFAGGGRYNHEQLGQQLDIKDTRTLCGVGAAIGIERVALLLEPIADTLRIPQPPTLHVIMPLAAEQHTIALLIADTLHAAGLCTDTLLEGNSVKSMMRTANKAGAAYALLIGDEEQKNKTIMIKNMISGEQTAVAHTDLISHLTA